MGGEIADRAAEVMQQRGFAGFHDGMNRVEPQSVEPIAFEPMEGIGDGERAHLRHAIVYRMAPGRMRRGKEPGRVAVKVVSLGPEVIVDHVEKHHQAAPMRFVDQVPQVVGTAVDAVGRIKQHTVVAPVPATGEIGNRHQLDCSYPDVGQMAELFDRGPKRSRCGERPDMKLQNGRILPRPSAPSARPPFEPAVIDDFAWPRHVLRLEVGRWVGNVDLAVDPVLVERAGLRARDHNFVPALRLRLHLMGTIQHELDAPGRGRPEAERDTALMQLCTKACAGGHAAPENARTDRGGACSFEPGANLPPSRGSGAVSSTTVQRPGSGRRAGSVNSIGSAAALSTM